MYKRTLESPTDGEVSGSIAPVDIGGTSAQTLTDARVALKLVASSALDANDGIVALDANKFISPGRFPSPLNQYATVQGSNSALTNTALTFTITNFDSRLTYNIVTLLGTYSRDGDTITYNTGAVGGSGGFTINGKQYSVNVVSPYVVKPSIASPVNNATNLGKSVTITGNAFAAYGQTDTHQNSTWQVSTLSDFSNIVFQTTDDAVNLTTWTVTGLNPATTYFVRVRYRGAILGLSEWSATSTFSTLLSFVATTEKAILPQTSVNGYGASVGISDDGKYAIVGSDEAGGAGYVYFNNGTTWALQQNLTISSSEPSSRYGNSCAINADGTYIVFGCVNNGIKVYTRSGTTWSLSQTFKPADYVTSYKFGYVVSMTADAKYIAVGSPAHNSYKGAIYILYRATTTFSQQAEITNPVSTTVYWGGALSINGDGSYLAVGCSSSSSSGTNVCIYTRSGTTWSLQYTITEADPYAGSTGFGTSVSISGDGTRLFVGAEYYLNSTIGGCVLVYLRSGNTWARETVITNPTPAGYTYFGHSLTSVNDGSYFFTGTPDAHKAYAFKRTGTTWALNKTYIASDDAAGSKYGYSLDCSADSSFVIVGAQSARKAYVIG